MIIKMENYKLKYFIFINNLYLKPKQIILNISTAVTLTLILTDKIIYYCSYRPAKKSFTIKVVINHLTNIYC